MTRRVNLLSGIIVCSHCGRRLRAQTPKGQAGYYREISHLNGFQDCPNSHSSVRADWNDDQIAEVICSLRLPPDWEKEVYKLLQGKDVSPDPEDQRREIRDQLRRMRVGYEREMFINEEHVFWREVEALQERLIRLEGSPDEVIDRAARTLLNLRESWENATHEEQRELVQMMLVEVGCSLTEQRLLWIKPRAGFEILFRLVESLKPGEEEHYWLPEPFEIRKKRVSKARFSQPVSQVLDLRESEMYNAR